MLDQIIKRSYYLKKHLEAPLLVLALITNKKNVEYAGAGGKILLKLGDKDACKIVYKQLGFISKESGKRFAKNIPGISFVAGVGLACSRFYSAFARITTANRI